MMNKSTVRTTENVETDGIERLRYDEALQLLELMRQLTFGHCQIMNATSRPDGASGAQNAVYEALRAADPDWHESWWANHVKPVLIPILQFGGLGYISVCNAIMAVLARDKISAEHYSKLTAQWNTVGHSLAEGVPAPVSVVTSDWTGRQMPDDALLTAIRLTPTEELVMEVLSARDRIGDRLWPFPSRLHGALARLEDAGLIDTMSGIVEHTIRANITDAGRAVFQIDPRGVRVPDPVDTDRLPAGVLPNLAVGDERIITVAAQGAS